MKRTQKEEIVSELKSVFEKSRMVVLTDYKGLDVAAISNLRKKLKEIDVDYRVVKNTLLVRASEGTDVALIKDEFKGPSAIAVTYDDPVAPAKALAEFAKENNKFEIKLGVLRGKVLSYEEIKAISSLPSREVLLGQLASVMNSVPTTFARLLSTLPQQMMNALVALQQKKEEEAS